MTRDLPLFVLKTLAASYGLSLIDDARRLEILLNEYCGFYYQEVQVLVSFLRNGWLAKLMNRASGSHDWMLYQNISHEVHKSMNIDEQLAFWTVSSWAEVLESLGCISKPVIHPVILTSEDIPEPLPEVKLVRNIPSDIIKPVQIRKNSTNKGSPLAGMKPRQRIKKIVPVNEEKRRLRRIPMSYYFRVFERWRKNNVIGHLVDANEQGLMLISEQPIKTNKIFRMRLSFPVKKEIVSVEFDAKSLWNKDDVMAGYYDTGFSLIDISQRDLKRIEAAFNLFGLRYLEE